MADTTLKSKLDALKFKSVFDVVAIPEAKFVDAYKSGFSNDIAETKKFYDAATYYANSIAHHYRSNTAFAAPAPSKTLATSPTYANLFPENVPVCPSDSINVQDSPVAYLVDLYQFITSLAVSSSPTAPLTVSINGLFEKRRPDIKAVCLSEADTNTPVSGLDIVNRILNTAITSDSTVKGEIKNVPLYEYFSKITYPIHFPFNLAYVQIVQCLKAKGLLLGSVRQKSDTKYPYFFDPHLGVDGTKQKNGFLENSAISPEQIDVITEANPNHDAEIIARNYGLAENALSQLNAVPVFLQRLSITRDELDQLLAINQYAPVASPNVWIATDRPLIANPTVYGASYIYHGDADSGPITITGTAGSEVLSKLTLPRLDFINRFVRFHHHTDLKYHELDWLFQCVRNTENVKNSGQEQQRFNEKNAIRAYGLFNYLRSKYSLTLKEFTALLDKLCPYSVDGEPSQFDKLFNANLAGAPPLKIDQASFQLDKASELDQQSIHQISTGLGIDYVTFQNLSGIIIEAQLGEGLDKVTRSLEFISASYRLTKLSQLFGFTVMETYQLLQLIITPENKNVLSRFLLPEVYKDLQKEDPDNISIIFAFELAAVWLKKNELTPTDLLMILEFPGVQPVLVATPQVFNVFNELNLGLQLKNTENDKSTTKNYTIDTADNTLAKVIAKLYSVDAQLAYELVQWVDKADKDFSEKLLGEVDKLTDVKDQNALQSKGKEFLAQLVKLERYITVVKRLKLGKLELQLLVSHPEYVDDEFEDKPILNLKRLYLLTRLKDWFAISPETEEKTLAYLSTAANVYALHGSDPEKDVNRKTRDDDFNECNALLAHVVDWNSAAVQEFIYQLASQKIAKTFFRIEWILRLRELSIKTGLPVLQLKYLLSHSPLKYGDSLTIANFLLATRLRPELAVPVQIT